jgi:hypothetical protein
MYGPSNAYDPQDVTRWKEIAEERRFRERLIAALKHPDVQAALAKIATGPARQPAGWRASNDVE